MSAPPRFWSKVSEGPRGCWVWIGRCSPAGYPLFKFENKTVRAHRWLFERVYGAVPAGFELDHLCRIRHCVRPSHLEIVTHKENMRRGIRAQQTHCHRGHPLDGDNLRLNGQGGRVCKACHLERTRQRRAHLKHWNRLTLEDVRLLQRLAGGRGRKPSDRGPLTVSALAKRFGVSRTTIQYAIDGRTYRLSKIKDGGKKDDA